MLKVILVGCTMVLMSCGQFQGSFENSASPDQANKARSNFLGMTFRDVERHRGPQKNRGGRESLEQPADSSETSTQPTQSGSQTDQDHQGSKPGGLVLPGPSQTPNGVSTQGQQGSPSQSGKPSFDSSNQDSTQRPNPSALSDVLPPEVTSQAIESRGSIVPSVYFFATMNEDKKGCQDNQRREMWDPQGKVLNRVCPKTYAECELQGTCMVVRNGKRNLYNIHSKKGGRSRFFEMTYSQCRYGYGVQSSCLDPFYTVAADLSIYKPGDVIHIPGVVGATLPDGSKHSGYFVVRDKGKAIKGKGRFDFYSGFISWQDPRNPFVKLGLSDKRTRIVYYKIKGELAKRVRSHRGFPRLRQDTIQHAASAW